MNGIGVGRPVGLTEVRAWEGSGEGSSVGLRDERGWTEKLARTRSGETLRRLVENAALVMVDDTVAAMSTGSAVG